MLNLSQSERDSCIEDNNNKLNTKCLNNFMNLPSRQDFIWKIEPLNGSYNEHSQK